MYNENFKAAFAESMNERMILPFIHTPDYQFPKKFEKKMQSLFKHPYSYIVAKNKIIPLRKIIICAVTALITLTLTFTTAAYWEEIKSFFMEIFTDHTRVTQITDDEYPDTIENIYMPEYIPNGFSLQESDTNILSTYFYYKSENNYFSFEQHTKNVAMSVNSELSDVIISPINGYDGFYLDHEEEIYLSWSTNEYMFIIMGDININEAVNIAKSVTNKE